MKPRARRTNRGTKTILATALLTSVAAVWLMNRSGRPHTMADPSHSQSQNAYSDPRLEQEIRSFELLAAEAAATSPSGPDTEPPTRLDTPPSSGDYARHEPPISTRPRGSSYDLAIYFVHKMGMLDPDRLLEHEALNPALREIAPAQRASFTAVVSGINERLGPLARHWRLTRTKEMILQIETGVATPMEPVSPSDSELRWLATSLLQSPEIRQAGHTETSLLADLRRQPPPDLGISENHIVHQGRAYATRQFRSLPISDGMFETVRFFAWESLATVHAWCVSHEMSPDHVAVQSAAQKLAALTASQYRGQ